MVRCRIEDASWLRTLTFPPEEGCFAKTRPWFNDEGVLLAAREWISGAGEHVTAYGLAKAVGNYLDSQRATIAVRDCVQVGPGGIGSEPVAGFTSTEGMVDRRA